MRQARLACQHRFLRLSCITQVGNRTLIWSCYGLVTAAKMLDDADTFPRMGLSPERVGRRQREHMV